MVEARVLVVGGSDALLALSACVIVGGDLGIETYTEVAARRRVHVVARSLILVGSSRIESLPLCERDTNEGKRNDILLDHVAKFILFKI